MPLGTRPDQTYEIVLSTDMDLPEADRPVFIFRYVNVIEWEGIAALDDEFEAATNGKESIKVAFKIIEETLAGWRNMKGPDGQEVSFNIMQLRLMLSMPEVTELMMAAVAQRPNVEDKKKLSSQSDLSTEPASTPAKNVPAQKNAST